MTWYCELSKISAYDYLFYGKKSHFGLLDQMIKPLCHLKILVKIMAVKSIYKIYIAKVEINSEIKYQEEKTIEAPVSNGYECYVLWF